MLYEAGNSVEVDPQRLRNIPIFAGLDEESPKAVAELLVTERYPRDRWIIREGDSGDRLFIIVRGGVAVSHTEKVGQERCVAVLEGCANFGEFATSQNVPGNAGVRTLSDCTLLSLAREHFLRLLIRNPAIHEEVERYLSEQCALDAASETNAGHM